MVSVPVGINKDLRDARRQWNILPAKKGELNWKDDKTPKINVGAYYIKGTKDINAVSYYHRKCPRNIIYGQYPCNYLCLTGKISGNYSKALVVVDFDIDEDIKYKDQNIAFETVYPELPEIFKNTLVVQTAGGGFHSYFHTDITIDSRQWDKKDICKIEGVSSIDIRGEKGYVIIPTSTVKGFKYTYVDKTKDIKSISVKDLEEALSLITIKSPTLAKKKKVDKIKYKLRRFRSVWIATVKGEIDIEKEAIKTGIEKHIYWTGLYGEALVNDIDPKSLFPRLIKTQKSFDIEKATAQIESRSAKNELVPLTNKQLKKMFPDYKETEKHVEEEVAIEITDNTKVFTFRGSKEMAIYKKGKFIEPKKSLSYLEEDIKRIISRDFPKTHYTAKLHPTLQEIRVRTYIDEREFDADPHIINCPNGYYNTETKEFKEHDDRNPLKTFIQIPIIYDPDKDCPTIDKFLHEVVGEEYVDIMYAFIGYCFLPTVKYHKAVLLQGDGANGKSTLIELINNAVGIDNTSKLGLDFIGKRFQNLILRGKLFNALGDISNQKIQITSSIKDAIAEYWLTSDVKQGSQATWRNTTKHMFSCNDPPIPYDDTYAFWRRWFYIECVGKFEGETKDPNMIDKITTKDELSGLLNRAIIGIERLENEGGFTDEYTDYVKNRWTRKLRPLDDFIDEHCYLGENAWVDKQEFVDVFNGYWKGEGYEELTVTKITRLLKFYKVKPMKGSRRAESGQEYKGITLKDNATYDNKKPDKFWEA